MSGRITYRTADGEQVPSVTTICALRAKPLLIPWANRLGLAGTDSKAVAQDAADIGTLTHKFIVDGLRGRETGTGTYSENQISLSKSCLSRFQGWARQHTIEPVLTESAMVSERYKYGGTVDLFADIDDRRTLLDIKTGRIWPDHIVQIAAYRQLLTENGHTVDAVCILSLRDNFTEIPFHENTLDKHFEIFLSLLKVYRTEKELKQ